MRKNEYKLRVQLENLLYDAGYDMEAEDGFGHYIYNTIDTLQERGIVSKSFAIIDRKGYELFMAEELVFLKKESAEEKSLARETSDVCE